MEDALPQGHGDAWGHYLTALRNQYELLRHPYFNWVSRSEFYNLQDIVIKVDFLDERKFAQAAAAKSKLDSRLSGCRHDSARWRSMRRASRSASSCSSSASSSRCAGQSDFRSFSDDL